MYKINSFIRVVFLFERTSWRLQADFTYITLTRICSQNAREHLRTEPVRDSRRAT